MDQQDNELNLLGGFDALITSLDKKIKKYEAEIAPKIDEIKILVQKEKERALKNSTKSTNEPQLNIPSWKLRTMKNLNWLTEEQALTSIQNFKTLMLSHLDVEPTAAQEKHFRVFQSTARKFFESMCGVLESCSDAMADYLMETKRTQPNALIAYDQAVALSIHLLQRLQDGITVKEFDHIASELMTLTKRIRAKMIEKRHYMTDRLAWRGIGTKEFNL